MNRQDAEEYTESLGQIVAGSWRQIAWAQRLGVPQSLGLTTKQWVNDRLGGYVKLSMPERREAVLELVAEGESNVAIAEVLGVDEGTVRNDRRSEKSEPNKKKQSKNNDDESGSSENSEQDELEQSRKREAALREQLKLAQTIVEIPQQQYGTIVIDPPWPMKKIERVVRPNQVEFDYPTMDYEQLRAFRAKFRQMAADQCHVFMWTTQKFLPMALRLFEDYEVKYVLTMVWHKPGGFQPVGLPQYNCEFVLYGRIGSPEFIDTKAFNCCFDADRGEHSRKPNEFYDLIRRVTPDGRVDIFSREKRPGFDQFGNEPDKFREAAE